MEPLIVSAKTLEDAITRACVELGVTSEMIRYDVKDSGSSGIFGIGARPCVISVTVKQEEPAPEITKEEKKAEPVRKDKPAPAQKEVRKERPAEVKIPEKKAAETEKKQEQPEKQKKPEEAASDSRSRMENAAAFLKGVFDAMKMEVEINAVQENEEEISIVLTGADMGVLIGKRGQTLDALQYLTGQVINKHYNDYVRVKIDTENYRERRKETLENLAVNIAGKVRRTRKPVALEPMNPYERRLIHSILQNEKDIFTRSEGEEPYRHVVIYCTRKKK